MGLKQPVRSVTGWQQFSHNDVRMMMTENLPFQSLKRTKTPGYRIQRKSGKVMAGETSSKKQEGGDEGEKMKNK